MTLCAKGSQGAKDELTDRLMWLQQHLIVLREDVLDARRREISIAQLLLCLEGLKVRIDVTIEAIDWTEEV